MFASVFEEQQREQHNAVQFFHVLKVQAPTKRPWILTIEVSGLCTILTKISERSLHSLMSKAESTIGRVPGWHLIEGQTRDASQSQERARF